MAGALQRAAEALRDQKVPYALIGGLAVGARGVPRFTADLDFAVAVEAAQEDGLVYALTQRGYGVEALLLDKKTRRPASVRVPLPSYLLSFQARNCRSAASSVSPLSRVTGVGMLATARTISRNCRTYRRQWSHIARCSQNRTRWPNESAPSA